MSLPLAGFLSQLRWRPQIGDPSFMGWLTVAAYALAAGLCLAAAFRDQAADLRETRARRRMWLAVALVMSFLCVNKQLDLQTLLTDVGRIVAIRGGWYGQRRIVQRWFVLAIAGGGVAALGVIAWKMRAVLKDRALLLLGLCSLVMFILIRAASFHHVDVFLRAPVLGIRMNWILELGGIALVALAAGRSCFRRPKRI